VIPRTLFAPEHETFRDSVRRFMRDEVAPHDERWQKQGYADRDVWLKAGANGFLCPSMPPEYGGAGADKLYSMALIEEQARANNSTLGFGLHSEIVAPQPDRIVDGGATDGLERIEAVADQPPQHVAHPAHAEPLRAQTLEASLSITVADPST